MEGRAEKPAAKEVGELFKRLAGAHYEGDAAGAGKDARALLFRGADGHRFVAAWTASPSPREMVPKK